jgi:hypothetical protein
MSNVMVLAKSIVLSCIKGIKLGQPLKLKSFCRRLEVLSVTQQSKIARLKSSSTSELVGYSTV